MAYDPSGEPRAREATDRDIPDSSQALYSVLELLVAYSSPVYLNRPTLHRFCSQSHIHDAKFQPRPIWEGARKYCFKRYSVLKKNSYFNMTHFLQRYYLNTNS